jgi:hypothetical protein
MLVLRGRCRGVEDMRFFLLSPCCLALRIVTDYYAPGWQNIWKPVVSETWSDQKSSLECKSQGNSAKSMRKNLCTASVQFSYHSFKVNEISYPSRAPQIDVVD